MQKKFNPKSDIMSVGGHVIMRRGKFGRWIVFQNSFSSVILLTFVIIIIKNLYLLRRATALQMLCP